MFAATRGGGATRNGEPIRCSDETDLSKALVATGFGYDPEQRREQGEVIARIIGDIRDIRRMGAAAVDLCSVACGRVDAYFERGLNPWDLAAGELIAAEAGCGAQRDRGRSGPPGLSGGRGSGARGAVAGAAQLPFAFLRSICL